MLLRQAKAVMEKKFSYTWQLLGALRTPTLTRCAPEHVADSLLKAKMRRGGTARGATPRRPTLQMLKKMEEEETMEEEGTMEEEEDEAEDGSNLDLDFAPILGELLQID